jgi:hypothetical protein
MDCSTLRRLCCCEISQVAKPSAELDVTPGILHRWSPRFEPELSGSAPQRSHDAPEEVEPHRHRLRDPEAEKSRQEKCCGPLAQNMKLPCSS